MGGCLGTKVQTISARELLILARKTAAKSLNEIASSPSQRLELCIDLLKDAPKNAFLSDFATRLSRLDVNHRHYWIGTFYTLLLPPAQRRAQATYFTPPHLSQALLRLVSNAGFDPLRHSAIDPAAGGAAFLSTLAAEMRASGTRPTTIVRRLRGVEIDRGLARLSEELVSARIGYPIARGSLVTTEDALRVRTYDTYDLVIANPPYGRVFPEQLPSNAWQDVCHPGHINKYALFAELCFRLAKPGALIALVLPSSFIAGPLYGRLRTFMCENGQVLTLGSVTTRDYVFVDVAQDVSIVVLRAGTAHRAGQLVSFGKVGAFGPFRPSAACVLPQDPGAPWMIAGKQPGAAVGGASLADYGAVLRCGYFVWNREGDRMRRCRRAKLDVPLIWACNIRANRFCRPRAKKRPGIDFVRFNEDLCAIVRTNAIVLQRTTNSSQPRRLVAARVSPSTLKRWGGFVCENHTIVITAPDVRTLNTLCFLLNSAAVDARYRQLSGTASISVNLLRELDLPTPAALSQAIAELGYYEAAIVRAYAISSHRDQKRPHEAEAL
jgi:adenine-specific DNA-methyltransferase